MMLLQSALLREFVSFPFASDLRKIQAKVFLFHACKFENSFFQTQKKDGKKVNIKLQFSFIPFFFDSFFSTPTPFPSYSNSI